MTDKQIEKARKNASDWIKGFKSGKYIRSDIDLKRNRETKALMYIGTKNLRQIIMIINELIYYKRRCEELEKKLVEKEVA